MHLFLMGQLFIQPTIVDGYYIPGRVNAKLGDVETSFVSHTRNPGDCKQYSRQEGYDRYVWSPELQPNNTGIHLTGICNGVRTGENNRRINALEQEIGK